MPLTLTVLGGSAAWPNPGQGCSAYLVQDGTTTILLDCGPNTLLELRKHVDYATIDAIVISHCHSDHILDLVPYRYGLTYGPTNNHVPIPVLLPPGGHERIDMLGDAFSGQGEPGHSFWEPAFALDEYDPDAILRIGDLRITFAPTQHFIPCFAMRVEDADNRTIFYSSDTGSVVPLLDLVQGVEVVIAEATMDQNDEIPEELRGHMPPEDAGKLATAAGAHTLILTHLWSERPDNVVETTAAEHFRGRILVAKPGMRIDA